MTKPREFFLIRNIKDDPTVYDAIVYEGTLNHPALKALAIHTVESTPLTKNAGALLEALINLYSDPNSKRFIEEAREAIKAAEGK